MNNHDITVDRLEQELLEYFDIHKDTASADGFYWSIGEYTFWIANGANHLTTSHHGFRIPTAFLREPCSNDPKGYKEFEANQLANNIFSYYRNWLDSNYKLPTSK